MRLWIALSALLIGYFSYGFYLSQSEIAAVPPALVRESPSGFYDYRGVINVHSDLSVGSSSPSTIVNAAKASSLDFLLLTDLNHFESSPVADGYHGRTLVLVGRKISYLDSRLIHYSPTENSLGSNLGEAQVKLADLLSQPSSNANDLLILAHPYKAGFSWAGEMPPALDGFELLNAKSLSNRSWEASRLSTVWSLLMYPFNPSLAFLRLFSEPSEEIELLDRLSLEQPTRIFSGAEASARAIPLTDYLIKFPSYQKSFEFLTNHVLLKSELTGNADSDRQKIFSALKNGNSYLCLELLGDPRGFDAYLEHRGRIFPMGSNVPFSKNMVMKIHLPAKPLSYFEIVIYRNGSRHQTFNVPDASYELTEPGVYRVQVRLSPTLPIPDGKRWITWIYTNPFTISAKEESGR